MSDRIKGVKIKYNDNAYSEPIPIGAEAQNVDYIQNENVKQALDKIQNDMTTLATKEEMRGIDFSDRIEKFSGTNSLILNKISSNQASGVYAIAEGGDTVASGQYSHAEGKNTLAEGNFSHAEGFRSKAYGDRSHAEGHTTHANGTAAHAEGYYSQADGWGAHAEGDHTIARNGQHVFGKYNIENTSNNYLEIVGNGTQDQRSNARTLDQNGNEWLAGTLKIGGTNYSDAKEVALGPAQPGSGYRSLVLGDKDNLALGTNSISAGQSHTVIKNLYFTGDANALIYNYEDLNPYYSALTEHDALLINTGGGQIKYLNSYIKITNIDFNNQTITLQNTLSSSQNFNHTQVGLLFSNIARGEGSIALGIENATIGIGSYAEGYRNYAKQYSHAQGYKTEAIGSTSHAEGTCTVASHANQHVFGRYNIIDPSIEGENEKGNYIEIVGNGSNVEGVITRSNARTLDWDGNEWIKGNLKIGGSSYDDENASAVVTQAYVDEQVTALTEQVQQSGSLALVLDSTLSHSGQAAPADKVGEELTKKIDKPTNIISSGKILSSTGTGDVQWIDPLTIGNGNDQAARGSDVATLSGQVTTLQNKKYIQMPSNGVTNQILGYNDSNSVKWVNPPDISALSSAVSTLAGKKYIQMPSGGGNNKILGYKDANSVKWINPLTIGTGDDQAAKGSDVVKIQQDLTGGSPGTYLMTGLQGLEWKSINIDTSNFASANDVSDLKNIINGTEEVDGLVEKVSNLQKNKVNIDRTLSVQDSAADAKAVGDALNNYKNLIFNTTNKKILFIADETIGGDNNANWIIQWGNLLGLKYSGNKSYRPCYWRDNKGDELNRTDYLNDRKIISSNDDYEILTYHRVGFTRCNYKYQKMTFEELLEDAHERKFQNFNFTDIIVCGGPDEFDCNASNSEATNYESKSHPAIALEIEFGKRYEKNNDGIYVATSDNTVRGSVKTFMEKAKNYYPNANIYVACLGSFETRNEENQNDNGSNRGTARTNRHRITQTIPGYKSCLKYGAIYLDQVQGLPVSNGISDGWTANNKGLEQLARKMAFAFMSPNYSLLSSNINYYYNRYPHDSDNGYIGNDPGE